MEYGWGGVVYMVLGAVAVAIYTYRRLGLKLANVYAAICVSP